MRKGYLFAAVLVLLLILTALAAPACNSLQPSAVEEDEKKGTEISLPEPKLESETSVEESIYSRVSKRSFDSSPLSLEMISQLLWASQGTGIDGVTGPSRTAPSAGATHPIDIFLVAGNIEGLPAGLYQYEYRDHRLKQLGKGDFRSELAAIALDQHFIEEAPASIVLAAVYERTTGRYGERGIRYVHMEIGHITQNIYLQAQSLELGAVAVGAFDDDRLKSLLEVEHDPLMIVPAGIPR